MKIPLKYNFRSLFVRKATTVMTIVSIAFVVLVYIGVLALAGGLKTAFAASGDPKNVIVLRDGAKSETESFFGLDKARLLAAMPGVARGPKGEPLASGQAFVLQILKRADGSESNVSLRGVEPAIFAIRPQVKVIEGRPFEPGRAEVIVGRNLAKRFAGLAIGQQMLFGRVQFRVVGIFDADGSSFNSEIWVPIADLRDSFRRGENVSTVVLQAASAEAAVALVDRIKADQQLKLQPKLETEYFAEQANANSRQFVILGNVLAVLMSFGACFAAANTMYAQVAARAKELGTLRAVGFPRRTILAAFLVEAAILGLLAGCVGALAALPLNSITAGTMNGVTFSEISFSLRTTPQILASGIFLAVITGVLGGLPPAIAASRRPITQLLREV